MSGKGGVIQPSNIFIRLWVVSGGDNCIVCISAVTLFALSPNQVLDDDQDSSQNCVVFVFVYTFCISFLMFVFLFTFCISFLMFVFG